MKTHKKQEARRMLLPAVVIKPTIDYPKEGELIGSSYTLRVSAPGALLLWPSTRAVAGCREAGHWWFDWAPEAAGEHEAIACAGRAWAVSGPGTASGCRGLRASCLWG